MFGELAALLSICGEPTYCNIVGMPNGQIVYDEILVVSDAVGKGRTTYSFLDFVPSEATTIVVE